MLSPKKIVNFLDISNILGMAFILVIVVLLLSCVFVWLAAPRKFRGR